MEEKPSTGMAKQAKPPKPMPQPTEADIKFGTYTTLFTLLGFLGIIAVTQIRATNTGEAPSEKPPSLEQVKFSPIAPLQP